MSGTGRRGRWSRWAPSSIRSRLLAGLLVVLVLGMTASTATSAALLLDFLHDRSADTLRESADRVEDLLARGPQTVDPDQLVTLLGEPMGIVVEDARGQVVGTSGSGELDPEAVLRATTAAPPGELVPYDTGKEDLLAVRIPTPDLQLLASDDGDLKESPAALVLTIDTDVDAGTVRELIAQQAVLVAGFLVVMAALAVAVLKLGLRPLRRMADTADAIAAGSLTERLPLERRATETDGLARAVNRAFDAQARAEENARSFAADASHELRTPLATISGWLDLYQQGALAGEGVGDAVGHIDAEVGRMRLIVEELGLLARLDAGRPLERADVDLVALAASVVEDAQVIDPDRAITLTADAPVHVVGDAPRLQQVLRNLAGNAVQHTPAGTAVQLAVTTRGDRAVLTVADDGPGIEPEHLPRVFERFWRAEASRSRAYGGSGLGLAIVQAIVQAHEGTVAVRSRTATSGGGAGTGTTVEVELPLAVRPAPVAQPSSV